MFGPKTLSVCFWWSVKTEVRRGKHNIKDTLHIDPLKTYTAIEIYHPFHPLAPHTPLPLITPLIITMEHASSLNVIPHNSCIIYLWHIMH